MNHFGFTPTLGGTFLRLLTVRDEVNNLVQSSSAGALFSFAPIVMTVRAARPRLAFCVLHRTINNPRLGHAGTAIGLPVIPQRQDKKEITSIIG